METTHIVGSGFLSCLLKGQGIEEEFFWCYKMPGFSFLLTVHSKFIPDFTCGPFGLESRHLRQLLPNFVQLGVCLPSFLALIFNTGAGSLLLHPEFSFWASGRYPPFSPLQRKVCAGIIFFTNSDKKSSFHLVCEGSSKTHDFSIYLGM